MGVKDTVTTKYMRQNEVFADTFNYFVYGGTQVISPDSLKELDTREIDVPYGGEKGAKQPVQKSDEYLSGFMKDDRLLPVVTLVVYFGSKEWTGIDK